MNSRLNFLWLVVGLIVGTFVLLPQAAAQVSGSGTPNTIPQFSDSSTLSSSVIFQDPSVGNVGINTITPASTLTIGPVPGNRDVTVNLNASGAAHLLFNAGCCGFHNYAIQHYGWGLQLVDSTIQTQIFGTWVDGRTLFGAEGAFGPNNRLSVIGGLVVDQNDDNADNMYYNVIGGNSPISPDFSLGLQFGLSSGEGIASPRGDAAPNLNGLDFYTSFQKRLSINSVGNVGIGTQTPQSSLEVNGNVTLTQGSGASVKFQDGTVQATAWNGTLNGQDYAEAVPISGDRKVYGPGDLIVMDAGSPGKFLKSAAPYSTLIAGIYSTKPGLLGKRKIGDASDGSDIPMAMIGIVPTKVSAENGAIHVGDLLVTSSTPGTAMRGTDPTRMMGAVLGKAMANFEAGTGVIDVLVRLQ